MRKQEDENEQYKNMHDKNLLFLDIDGVLNSHQWIDRCLRLQVKMGNESRQQYEYHNQLDEEACDVLAHIVKKFDLHIIISSSWHITGFEAIKDILLYKYGIFNRVIGVTPRDNQNHHRGTEIKSWFELTEKHQLRDWSVNKFVILDDDSDIEPFMDKFVKIDRQNGLRYQNIPEIEAVLNCQ